MTKKRLKEALWYDHLTGDFLWRSHGRVAGTTVKAGPGLEYRKIMIDGKCYLAHRLAWLYSYGKWPVNTIDHINGDGLDNRVINLRDVTPEINHQNHYRRSSTRKGLPVGVGATKGRKHGAYTAKFTIRGKQIYLGRFDTPAEASDAYQEAKDQHLGKLLEELI